MPTQTSPQAPSAQQLSASLVAMGAVPWRACPHTRAVHFEPAINALLKRSADQALDTLDEFLSYVHEDYRTEFCTQFEQVYKNNTALNFEFRIRENKTGASRWLQAYMHPEQNGQGHPQGIHGVLVDAHERIEKELRHQELSERRALAFEAAQVGGWTWRVNEARVTFDPQLEGLYRIPSGSFDGDVTKWLDIIHPEDREEVTACLIKSLKNRSEFRIQYRLAASGEPRWLKSTGKPTAFGADGRVSRVSGATWEVTAEVQAQQRAEQAMARMSATTAATQVGFWEVDASGDCMQFDSTWRRILGLPKRGQVSKATIRELTHPDDQLAGQAQLNKMLIEGKEASVIFRSRHAITGEWRYVESRGAPLRDAQGRIVGAKGIAVDRTEEKKAQAEIDALRQRHEYILQSNGIATWTWQVAQDVIDIGTALTSVSRERPPPQNSTLAAWLDTLHPADQASAAEHMQRSARGEGVEFRYRVPQPDGQVLWLLTRAEAIETSNHGEVLAVGGTTMDISSEMQARAQAEKTLRRVEAAVQIGGIAFWEIDLVQQTFDYDSAGRRDSSAIPNGPLPLAALFAMVGPQQAQRMRSLLTQAQTQHHPIETTVTWYRERDQREVVLHLFGNTIRDSAGNVSALAGVAVDETEAVASAAEAKRIRTLLETALLSVRATAFTVDKQQRNVQFMGDPSGLAELTKPVQLDQFDTVMSYVHEQDRSMLVAAIDQLLNTGEPADKLYRVRNPDTGKIYWHHMLSQPQRDDQGVIIGMIGIVVDETQTEQRRQADAMLRERYLRATQAAGVGGWSWNEQTRRLDLDPIVLEMFGMDTKASEHSAASIFAHVAAADRQRISTTIETKIRAGEGYEVRFRRKLADGSLRWTMTRGQPVVLANDGSVKQMAGATWDIDDEMQAQSEMERTKILLTEALNATRSVVFSANPQTQKMEFIGDVNSLLGLPPGPQILSFDDVFERIHEEDRQPMRDALEKIIREKQPAELTHRVPGTHFGRTGWRRVAAHPQYDETGQVVGVIGVTTDESEAVERRQELQALRDTYDYAMRSAGIGNWVLNLDPISIEYDTVMAKLLDIDLESFDGKLDTVLSFFVEEDRHLLVDAMQAGLATGEAQEVRQRRRMPDGSIRWFCSRGASIKRDNGPPTQVTGATWDITTVAQLNEALERSNRELDDFAYIASHDLREPLRGIRNYTDFITEDYADRLDDEGRKMLAGVNELSQRLDELLGELLHFSRVGRVELACVETDTDALVRDILKTLEYMLAENRVRVSIPTPLPKIVCDRVRARELFINLITNAAKYNDKNDKWVEIGHADGNFYVRDNGIGIAEENIERAFKIFKRLHPQNAYGGGTGSGLTIAKQIAERHGGQLWVESHLGEGTTFYFNLGGPKPVQVSN